MSCYYPLVGYRAKHTNPDTGKRPIVFKPEQALDDNEITLPCGRCTGCRLDYSRNWAIRCVHEAQMHEENSFITLTYNDESLPADRSINKETLRNFFKRLRKHLAPKKIRYFACGEYGEENWRPHYHAIIFGHSFPDRKLWKKTNGICIYRSQLLESVWTEVDKETKRSTGKSLGYSSVGDVTFQSAAYVARYTMKKHRPDKRDPEAHKKHYQVFEKETGEIHQLEPEFCIMSRMPGIGKTWLQKFKTDTDKDYITVQGKTMSLPKYYDNLLTEMGEDIDLRKIKRRENIDEHEQTYYRLKHKQQVKEAQIKQLIRNL